VNSAIGAAEPKIGADQQSRSSGAYPGLSCCDRHLVDVTMAWVPSPSRAGWIRFDRPFVFGPE
jgi:hypothetical protein